jgi:hypothetical protein
MREDLPDHWLFPDRRNDLQFATAVRAVLHVDLEDVLEQLGPAHAHRSVVRAVRLASGGLRGVRRRLGYFWHHQRAQLGVGGQDAFKPNQAQRRGSSVASFRMNSSGDMTRCMVPSRQAALSFRPSSLAASACTRSLGRAGRVM